MSDMRKTKQEGSTLLFVVMIMTFVMTLGLTVAQVISVELRLAGDFGASTASFFGAQSAVEEGILSTVGSQSTLGGTEYYSEVNYFPGRGYGFINRGRTSSVQRSANKVIVEPTVSINNQHGFVLSQYGQAWGAGGNAFGGTDPLGLNDSTDRYYWTPIMNEVITIEASRAISSLALRADGSVWAAGSNQFGELGLGDNNNRDVWTKTIDDIKYLSVGEFNSFVIKNDSTVWATGRNDYGQLGIGSTGSVNSWTPVPSLSNIVAIKGGGFHSLAIDENDNLFVAGRNNSGQLGTGGGDELTWVSGGQSNIIDIGAGLDHSIIVKTDGSVLTAGDDFSNCLGRGGDPLIWGDVGLSGIIDVDAGGDHSMALDSSGDVWVAGYDASGQLGLQSTPQQSDAFTQSGSVDSAQFMSGGGFSSIVLKSDGTLMVTGYNFFGQLGPGYGFSNVDGFIPINYLVL